MAGIVILSVDRTLAARVGDALGGRVPVDLVQALEPGMIAGPTVIIVDRSAISPDRSVAATISSIVQDGGGCPVVLASDERDADQVLRAIRAGASDVIDRAGEHAEIGDVLMRLLNQKIAETGETGRMTLVLGADHDAAAMVATDIAIARGRGRPGALLIDFTLPTSAAEVYLDLRVDYGLASAVADIERMDTSLLSSALTRHEPSGLMLLTFDGGTGGEPVGIAPGDIAALVRLLRASCTDLVLCAGSLRHGALLRELAEGANRIELVCSQSIRQLEASRRLLDRIGADAATLDRMRLLLWDHQPGILLDGRRMADALGIGGVLGVPVDPVRSRNALNAGRPLALEADGGPYMQAIRRACGIAGGNRSGQFGATIGSTIGGFDRLKRAVLKAVERAP